MTGSPQKIIPHLWFDTQAIEAAGFYASVFPDSKITGTAALPNTPAGDCDLVSFTIWGMPFQAISGGPQFTINPSISFIVNFDPLLFGVCETAKTAAMETQTLVWDKLVDGGKVLMPLDHYSFSERFGFVEDRYGVSWQLMLTRPEGEPRPPIVPAMMFINDNCGWARDAVNFYLKVFNNSKLGGRRFYGPDMAPNIEDHVMFSDCLLENTWLAALDAGGEHAFDFNEAVSFMVYCDNQADIDHYWHALNADPDDGRCGWLKDKFGVSWQIVPAAMHDWLYHGSQEQVDRLMATVLAQKKLDIAALQLAFDGKS